MSGVTRYLTGLIPELVNLFQNDEFILFANSESQKRFSDIRDNVYIENVDISPAGLKQHIMISGYLRKYEPDIYHYPMYDLPLFISTTSVINIYDMNAILFRDYFTCGRWWKRVASKRLHSAGIKKAERIITPSYATAESIFRIFPYARNKVIPIQLGYKPANDVEGNNDINELKEKYNIFREYILYVGVHRPHKNLEGLIKAIMLLNKRGIIIDFVVAGSDDKRFPGAKNEVKRLKIEERVKFIGHVTENELTALYKNAKAMIFPSFDEGFGFPLLEAMENSTPIACSDIPVHREVADKAAIYFNPYSTDEIGQAILRLLKDEELRMELINAGKYRVKKFKWEDSARKTMEAYRQAVREE